MTLAALVDRWAERQVMSALSPVRCGRLIVQSPGGRAVVGDEMGEAASLTIHDRRFFRRALSGGELGLGEAYVDGDWSTPDLVGLIRFMLAHRYHLPSLPESLNRAFRVRDALVHRLRDNTRAGSRKNIHAHYDLGNEFFQLFLDANLLYSCAFYRSPDDSLEVAQLNKLRLICDKLALQPEDRVLEIGTGWGGFAVFAATRYGCHVTTTTISREQHAYAVDRVARSGLPKQRVDVLFEDYRDLRGRFDKIVSIEMFEAVGLAHYDAFFGVCNRALEPGGAMLLQTITVDDWRFREYLSAPSWIAKHIFPGAELASVAEMLASLARVSRLGLCHAQQIGSHYAQTLHHWRERFHQRLDDVRALGFDERFVRTWDLYLAYCEAAFLERHIGDVQLVFTKWPGRAPRGSPSRHGTHRRQSLHEWDGIASLRDRP